MKHYLSWFFLFAILSASLLTACSDADLSYAPVAYGENGHCYYVTDPAEVVDLQQAGLCPRTWTPLIMPIAWHSMYYAYYDSPAYYNYYVPVSRRTYYSTVVVRKFETVHKTDITKYSSKAKYKGSDGKSYSTTQVKSKGFSSGSARQNTSTKTKTSSTTTKPKTTSSSSTTRTKTTTQSKPSTSRPSTSSRSTTTRSTGGFRSGGARR